jgi:hypothetical protein
MITLTLTLIIDFVLPHILSIIQSELDKINY